MTYYIGTLPTVVTEEETVAEYNVKTICGSCDFNTRYGQTDSWIFNMNTGTLHFASANDPECTACGRNATGKEWLWRL